MAGYIALCDHNIEWQELFLSKLCELGIDAVCTENIEDIEGYLDDTWFRKIVVCSLIELNEYLKKHQKDAESIFEKTDIFVISDKRDDEEEIKAIRSGCVDFQLRERDIRVIIQRLVLQLEKKMQQEKTLIDIENMSVKYKNVSVAIKDNEARLLRLLSDSEEKYISVEKICENLWESSDKDARVRLASLVYRLRRKLPDGGKCIRSIYGKGYYLSKNEIQRCV